MSWSDEAWSRVEHIYNQTLELDFLKKLADGSLPQDQFLFYMEQDKLYLDDYSSALALIGAKSPDSKDTAMWSGFSQNAAIAEQSLHDFYINHFGGGMRSEIKKSPTCELYTSFLLKHAALSPVEVAAAAVLPCFWVYESVGKHHYELLKDGDENPYRKWIELYNADGFSDDVAKAINYVNKVASQTTPEKRELMFEAFTKACILELMFWKTSTEKQEWVVPV